MIVSTVYNGNDRLGKEIGCFAAILDLWSRGRMGRKKNATKGTGDRQGPVMEGRGKKTVFSPAGPIPAHLKSNIAASWTIVIPKKTPVL